MSKQLTNSILWRWIALISVIFNVVVNYYSNVKPFNGMTIGEISNKYPTLFTPAGYAFSIWGLIYLSFVIYIIVQLLPSQRKVEIYDQLAKPLTISSLLSIIWVLLFSYELIGLSVVVIISMLITALLLYIKSKRWTQNHKSHRWLSIPFSLYAGWLTVATIAATATWLYSIDWKGGFIGEMPWAIIMIVISFIIVIFISYKYNNIIYPLVVAWAFVAIWVAREGANNLVASVALFGAILIVLWCFIQAIKAKRNHLAGK